MRQLVLSTGVYYFSDITLGQNAVVALEPGAEVTIYMTGDLVLGNRLNSMKTVRPPSSDLLLRSLSRRWVRSTASDCGLLLWTGGGFHT